MSAELLLPYPGVMLNSRAMNRDRLRRGWNTTYLGDNTKLGNFRSVNNAGDPLSRVNYSCGGANMVTSRPGVLRFTSTGGLPSTVDCDGSGVPPSTCNVKYVYDSSDFTRFKKLYSINKGYGGLGKGFGNYSGGGANNGAQVSFALARI